MATERQLPGPHSSPSDTRDGHFGGEHLLLGIFDTASLKGEHSYLGESSKSWYFQCWTGTGHVKIGRIIRFNFIRGGPVEIGLTGDRKVRLPDIPTVK